MSEREARHRVISTFLQAGEPLGLGELAARTDLGEEELRASLDGLVDEGLVVAGRLLPARPPPQYCWGARWRRDAERRLERERRKLEEIVNPLAASGGRGADIGSEAAAAFHRYVTETYEPPAEKRYLVFLQCSVRRPFSTSPSHASMRRAIAVATGCDPARDFHSCPVHVVVLASSLGPVPYEFEDIHPANVRGGGVKHFSESRYRQVRPELAGRMAAYLLAHRGHYDRIATFTEGRYAQVMEDVRATGVRDFPILPDPDGPAVGSMGGSAPRAYWQKYWIQLYLEVVSWLSPGAQARAAARLRELAVDYL